MVEQRVLLGFVSDVFEVMAQVGRRLTKVNTVDLLIRVNNSG
jgi:L-lysine 2,3-aminomutase